MRRINGISIGFFIVSALLWAGCFSQSHSSVDPDTTTNSDPFPDTDSGSSSDSQSDFDSDSNLEVQLDCELPEETSAMFSVDESLLSFVMNDGGLVVSLPVETSKAQIISLASVWLLTLDGTEVADGSTSFVSNGSINNLEIVIDGIPDNLTAQDMADYVIDYELTGDAEKTNGRRSAFEAMSKTQAVLRGPDEFLAGTTNALRLYVQDPSTSQALQGVGATFTLVWEEDGQTQSQLLFEGTSDEFGTINASFDVDEQTLGNVNLLVEIDDGSVVQNITAPIQVTRPQSILLTTDKPIYQPGQTMHLRSLALRRPDLVPEAGASALFEVMDSKGNKVFKQEGLNDDWGIASAQFQLASEVLLGTYTIRVTIDETVSEKTVTVDRYSLPKYGITVETDKAFYKPGETMSGSVDVQYFFGKPVDGGEVTITANKFDLAFEQFSQVSGTTNSEGRFDFQIQLPTYFVGQPLDQGNAFVLLAIAVTDTAGQSREVEMTKPVVESAILSQVVPESGDLVPNVANRFYLLTTNPQGQPIATTNSVTLMNSFPSITVETDDSGIGVFLATPTQLSAMSVLVKSEDAAGNEGIRSFNFTPGQDGAYVLLRTDKSVYAVGETAQITVNCPNYENAATAFKDRVYLDIIKDGRTTLMTTVELTEGVGDYFLDISPELTGGFELEAYYLSSNSQIMRDRKLVYADPADQLHIDITSDKDIYAPAEDAQITFTVSDKDGLPVPSAIGLQIVDEAVYALMEFKPGLEKVFYALEDEILTPRYEVHGYDFDDVANGNSMDQRDEAAQVLFAAAGGGSFGINADSFDSMSAMAKQKAIASVQTSVYQIQSRLNEMCQADEYNTDAADAYIYLNALEHCWLDPWNGVYTISYNYNKFTFTSAGPDESWNTTDDIQSVFYFYCGDDWGSEGEGEGEGEWEDADSDSADNGAGGEGSPRVRKNFPETLYVNPALITDANGTAQITIPMADSITTWRMGAIASSAGGLLGSTEHGITVFQDFFVDIDFPATLTQDDEISLPVAIYNYLDEAQSVTISIQEAGWFELLDVADKDIEMGPGEVLGSSFTIRVKDVGWHSLRIYGYGSTLSDAVERTVEVVPNGKEIVETESGRLDEIINFTAIVPTEAIDDASKVMVKIYPGMVSQAVEGLDSMLKQPSGCFEQTSSATYPNVLILDYMMSTGQVTPEIELKARSLVNQGYQRLLTFESDGGGFEWFGGTPAHNILTAYGLLEFYDMSRVHPVDPAVITRTQQWLANQQQSDGHFEPTHGGIAEGAINAYEDDVARTTAYIIYALVESGYTGSAVADGISWLKNNHSTVTDNYGLAMFANAMVAYDKNDPVTSDLLLRLHDARTEDGDQIYWTGTGESTTYGNGDVMTIETTALVAYAMLRAGQYSADVQGAINYLIVNKDSLGNWSTTQATVLTLRLLLASAVNASDPGPATIRIYAHDTLVQTLDITTADSDVLRLVDLGEVTLEGNNDIRIEIDSADSSYMYQVISRYYMPWADTGEGSPSQGPLSIEVIYDKTNLEVDDIARAKVTVTNNIADSVAKMVLVDIGLPPGFDLITQDLETAVQAGTLQKFEKTERTLILYIEAIKYAEPSVFNYQLRARYPLSASSGESEVHPYYEPDQSTQQESTNFEVTE